jgi:hypothetical protein
MDEMEQSQERVKVSLPIRVRGMSSQSKFFDEPSETYLVSDTFLVTRLQNLVDLETEIYVTSMKTDIGGTFRVLWVNTQAREGRHDIGLELVQPEGDIWEMRFPTVEEGRDRPQPVAAWLECRRCHRRQVTPLPEVEAEFLREGLLIALDCDQCRATTSWEFVGAAEEAGAGAETAGVQEPPRRPRKDQRRKGRAPLSMQIQVTRGRYGSLLHEVCKTINVSRHGVYFLSSQSYEVGEEVSVVLPYKEGEIGIPILGRVVRQDDAKESSLRAVAIKLEEERK